LRKVHFVDTTLRDAHQSLWATRMTTAMMLPICDRLNRVGYECVDFMGLIHFDVCVRYLKEDPWERIRLVRKRITDVPLKSWLRSNSLIGFDVLPDDINALWVERLAANGIGMVTAFDALADLDNIVPNLRLAKRLGMRTCGGLVFCESPVHTDEFFAAKAKALVESADVDWIMIKDSGGLLGIDRIRTLVPALRAAIGATPIELHSHCLTGLAPIVYHEGVKLGVDIVDTSIAPLANGPAQPATQTMVANLRSLGYDMSLDMAAIEEVSTHFRRIAEQEGLPLGVPMAYDAFHYEHQLPGGMLTNLKYQLATAGLSDRFGEVLEECARIRHELAWPIMVTPFAQLVGTQAVFNVVNGERYRVVPDEVKKYVLGYYGKLLAPVDQEAFDRIVSNGSARIAMKPAAPAPAVDALRKKYPAASDEERLLRFCFAGNQVDEMRAAGPIRTEYLFVPPLERLMKELTQRKSWHYVRLEGPGIDLTLQAGAAT
jgi:oxaloacetate decarboxylase (Na+ extruding) subunit alpha